MSSKRHFGRIEADDAAACTSTNRVKLLHPLERALLYELGPRVDAIRARQDEVAFWDGPAGAALLAALRSDIDGARKGKGKEKTSQFTQEEEDELRDKRARVEELLGGKACLDAIIFSAEESRAVLSALSARTLPSSHASGSRTSDARPDVDGGDSQSTFAPLTSPNATDVAWADNVGALLEEHDEQALHFLRLRSELEALKDRRATVLKEIQTIRSPATTLLSNLRDLRATMLSKAKPSAPHKGAKGTDPLSTLRELVAKREMVRGVLRALILESGMDWAHDPDKLQLMLNLAEDDEEGEDDDDDDDDDDEEEEEGGKR